MDNIQYRSIEKKDYSTICYILSDSFGLKRYVNNSKVLNVFQKQYLYSCLTEATYTCVAIKNGIVIGVLMANSKKKYSVLSHVSNSIAMMYYSILLWLFAIIYHQKLEDYRKIHTVYATFLKDRKHQFDGVLTLFAVTESCQGLGVGKQLVFNLNKYLKENNAKNIYLFTDSSCNYGFYDSQGFIRIDEKNIVITCHQKPMNMTVFLYQYNIEN